MTEQVLRTHTDVINEYIQVMQREINPSTEYIRVTKYTLNKLDVMTATREDILAVLDRLRKPESEDPLHKWIGTYNHNVVIFKRFFKWFNNPFCMEGITRLKRKEKSIYKPSDLWTEEDDLLFLRYCPSKRDRCYHAISRDSSCRPSEILRIRIKDIIFKVIGTRQYAEVLVNGKTGSRHIPLINSIPYIKDWLDSHPQRSNPNAYLIYSKNTKGKLGSSSINFIYSNYKRFYFPSLIRNENVPVEDKNRITALLQKPWNPYIRRHSALTDKSKILKEHILRQHAGWTHTSDMPSVYLHYFGNESSDSILEAYGLKQKEEEIQPLKPKQCPNCSELNAVDANFCHKCRMILTYKEYQKTIDENNMLDEVYKMLREIQKKL
jgi:integrase